MRRHRPRHHTARTPRAEPPRSTRTELLPPPPPSRLERWAMLDVWCAQLRKCAGLGFNQSLVHGNGERRLVSVYLNLQHLPRERWGLALVRCRQALELLSVVAIADPRAWFELLDKRLSCANLPTDDNKSLPTNDSKYAPILPRFVLKLATKQSDPDAKLYAKICSTFFGVSTYSNELAERGFERAKAAVWSRLTPQMHEQLRVSKHKHIGIRLVFRPPNGFATELVSAYLRDVKTLVSAIHAKAELAQRTVSADAPYSIDTVFSAFPFVLEQAMLDLHDTIALPPSGPQQLVELLALGVQVTQDGIWSPARFSITPDSTFGRLSVSEMGPLLTALTTARPSPMGVVAPEPVRWGALDDNNSVRHLEFITRARLRSSTYVRKVEAICAALSASSEIEDLELMKIARGYTGATRRTLWYWLAYALFSRDASKRLTSVTMSCWQLSPEDMDAIMTVARAADPARLLLDLKSLASIHDDIGDDTGADSDDGYYDDGGSEDDDDDDRDDGDINDDGRGRDAASTVNGSADHGASHAGGCLRCGGPTDSTRVLADSVAALQVAGDGDESDHVDDDECESDTVVLRAGTTVRVSPFDPERDPNAEDDTLVLERESHFRIIQNKRSLDYVDIVVPCYGYCTVARASVHAFTKTLSPEVGDRVYTGALESLDLSFAAGTSADTYLPLVHFVGAKLKVLRLSFDTAISVDNVARILAWCPNLERLSLSGAEAGVARAFVDAYRENRCKISDLFIAKFLPSPATMDLLRALQDPTTTAAKTLTKSLALRPENHDEATLLGFADMLRGNSRLEFLFVTIPSHLFERVAPQIETFNRQLLPTQLKLPAKIAFLSAMARLGYQSQPKATAERASVTAATQGAGSSGRIQLNAEVVAKIFQFAAERSYRAVMCYPM